MTLPHLLFALMLLGLTVIHWVFFPFQSEGSLNLLNALIWLHSFSLLAQGLSWLIYKSFSLKELQAEVRNYKRSKWNPRKYINVTDVNSIVALFIIYKFGWTSGVALLISAAAHSVLFRLAIKTAFKKNDKSEA